MKSMLFYRREDSAASEHHLEVYGKEWCLLMVNIPEELFFEIVDTFRNPQTLNPAKGECVIHMDQRNKVLDPLLQIRRAVVEDRMQKKLTHIDVL